MNISPVNLGQCNIRLTLSSWSLTWWDDYMRFLIYIMWQSCLLFMFAFCITLNKVKFYLVFVIVKFRGTKEAELPHKQWCKTSVPTIHHTCTTSQKHDWCTFFAWATENLIHIVTYWWCKNIYSQCFHLLMTFQWL